MAITSTTFGGVTLTDEDARAFEEQFVNNQPQKNAVTQTMIEKGDAQWKEYQENGYTKFDSKNHNHS